MRKVQGEMYTLSVPQIFPFGEGAVLHHLLEKVCLLFCKGIRVCLGTMDTRPASSAVSILICGSMPLGTVPAPLSIDVLRTGNVRRRLLEQFLLSYSTMMKATFMFCCIITSMPYLFHFRDTGVSRTAHLPCQKPLGNNFVEASIQEIVAIDNEPGCSLAIFAEG